MRDGCGQRKLLLFQIICKTLRRPAHGVDIHAVRARAQNAAQAAGAKGELAAKRLLPFLFAHVFQLLQQLRLCDVREPTRICLLHPDPYPSFSIKYRRKRVLSTIDFWTRFCYSIFDGRL